MVAIGELVEENQAELKSPEMIASRWSAVAKVLLAVAAGVVTVDSGPTSAHHCTDGDGDRHRRGWS